MITNRLNNKLADDTILLQHAISSVLDDKAAKSFEKTIKKLKGA